MDLADKTPIEGTVSRARVAMVRLLIECLQDPLDPEPLREAAAVQDMIRDDLAAVGLTSRA